LKNGYVLTKSSQKGGTFFETHCTFFTLYSLISTITRSYASVESTAHPILVLIESSYANATSY